MWDYTDKVKDHFFQPRNAGTLSDANAVGEVGSISCGDALKLMMKVDPETEVILDAKFQTFGCGSAIASSSALTELVIGKTVAEAASITNLDIAHFLGGLPPQKMHCSVMGQEALAAAIANFRGVALDDDHEEGALVCKCFAVDEPMLRRAIRTNLLTTLEQVTHYTKAGGGCGACNERTEEVLAATNAEMAAEGLIEAARAFNPVPKPPGAPKLVTIAMPKKPAAPVLAAAPVDPAPAPAAPAKLTLVQKLKLVEEALAEARPTLQADGGDVELVDLDGRDVYVKLTGACAGCRMARVTVEDLASRIAGRLGLPANVIPV